MKRKNKKTKRKKSSTSRWKGTSFVMANEWGQIKRLIEKQSEELAGLWERLGDAEIHINLLTRLITTLCVEKMGMRVGVLKRLLKRIEKEAIRDSQIFQLESLYNLPHQGKKSSVSPKIQKRDPWDDVS